MRGKLWLFGIPGGRYSDFYGQTYIFKAKRSYITLGKGLIFRSYPNSNLIGINRNCALSTLRPNAQIIIGDHCGLSGTVIGAFSRIELGKGVMCGANTLITDSDWHTDDPRSGECKPISIGDNVWLGVNVTVLKGVTIGQSAVIGACSVVTKDIPSNVIAAGNPCKVIKAL